MWDRLNRMNPGKGAGAALNGYRLDDNLRLGPGYRPPQPRTYFSFAADGGSFARATERCFGVAQCRAVDGHTMCPSFQVTHDEKYTTRGRARLLFEMLQGDAITDGWRNEEIKESLDLCLSCKGCRGDCPVHVDVATLVLNRTFARTVLPVGEVRAVQQDDYSPADARSSDSPASVRT